MITILEDTRDLKTGETIRRGRTGEVSGGLLPHHRLGYTVTVRLHGERKTRKFWHKVVDAQGDNPRTYPGRDTPLRKPSTWVD